MVSVRSCSTGRCVWGWGSVGCVRECECASVRVCACVWTPCHVCLCKVPVRIRTLEQVPTTTHRAPRERRLLQNHNSALTLQQPPLLRPPPLVERRRRRGRAPPLLLVRPCLGRGPRHGAARRPAARGRRARGGGGRGRRGAGPSGGVLRQHQKRAQAADGHECLHHAVDYPGDRASGRASVRGRGQAGGWSERRAEGHGFALAAGRASPRKRRAPCLT